MTLPVCELRNVWGQSFIAGIWEEKTGQKRYKQGMDSKKGNFPQRHEPGRRTKENSQKKGIWNSTRLSLKESCSFEPKMCFSKL